MIDVKVSVDGIIMYCDESICMVNLGNGYSIQKVYLKNLPYKTRIIDGNGNLNIAYRGSVCEDEQGEYFFCFHKDDTHQINGPQIQHPHGIELSAEDLSCEDELIDYGDSEQRFLLRMFSLLHLFKKGNIGYNDLFFRHQFQLFGFVDSTRNHCSHNATRNITDNTIFTLSAEEAVACNQFLSDYSGQEYEMLRSMIEEFVWGLEQVDIGTGFEQYTTALEMTLLETHQRGKKEALAKRVAVLLENNPTLQLALYNKMKNYYRFRSESLHEGDDQNISMNELKDLEEIVRAVLNKYLYYCKGLLNTNPTITWDDIKNRKINELKSLVSAAKSSGVLPN